MRPQGASLLGSDFGLVGGFTSIIQEGGSYYWWANQPVWSPQRWANSPGTWFLALSTQGVLEGFRCEVSREANNNMVLIMRGLHLLENLPAMLLFWKRSSVSMIKGYRSKVECLEIFSSKFMFSHLLMEHWRLPGGPRLWVLESRTLAASLNFRRSIRTRVCLVKLLPCSKRMNPLSGREWRLGIALLVFCQSDCLRGWSSKIEQKLINLTHFCKIILKSYLNWRFRSWIHEERDWTTNSEGEIHVTSLHVIWSHWSSLHRSPSLWQKRRYRWRWRDPFKWHTPTTKKFLRSRIGTNIFWKHLEHPKTNRFAIFRVTSVIFVQTNPTGNPWCFAGLYLLARVWSRSRRLDEGPPREGTTTRNTKKITR